MSKKHQHGKTSFQENWLSVPEFKNWLKKIPNDCYSAGCKLCPGTLITVASMGRQALTSHMRGAKHKSKAEGMAKSPSLNTFFHLQNTPRTTTTMSSMDFEARQEALAIAGPSTASLVEEIPEQRSCPSSFERSKLKQYLLNEDVTKAEVLWCIESVMTHDSMRSSGRHVALFKRMFPDSEIAQKMELQRTKIGYTIVFGLAPYFRNQLMGHLKNCEFFVVAFDESLNKISQKQQMDLVVRYWDTTNEQVTTRYLTSTFLTRATAIDLLENFQCALKELNLSKLLQVSMDGPNVNFSFLRELKLALKEDGNEKTLVDFGSCGIHTVHNAFKKAISVTGWDIVKFLRACYNVFKDVPARRGIYMRVTQSHLFPLKFCAIRWLENAAVAQRAMDILPHLKTFMNSLEDEKTITTSASMKTMKDMLKDPLLGPKLAFFKTLASDSEPFLTDFQSNWPLAPFLYTGLSLLVETTMERVVKPGLVKTSVDLKNEDNMLHFSKVNIGFSTRHEMSKCKNISDQQIASFRKECKSALKSYLTKILEKSPMSYPITKFLTCFDPAVAIQPDISRSRIEKLLTKLVELGWLSGSSADKALHQYKELCNITFVKNKMESFKRKKTRLDNFWIELIGEYAKEAVDLKRVVCLVLILSHGNAEVERGFSVNKECLVENMAEETLIGYRQVYDAVQKMGGIHKVPLEKSMLNAAKNAHSLYKENKEKQKKANADADAEKLDKKRKKTLLKELEEKRQKVMEEARLEAQRIETQMNELTK